MLMYVTQAAEGGVPRTRRSLRAIIPLLGLLLASCTSPLEVNTERIDTKLTNGLKLRTISTSVRITRGTDTSMTQEEWAYTVTASSFRADTTADPPGISLRLAMQGSPGPAESSWLKEISIRLDDTGSTGSIPLAAAANGGNSIGATVMIGGVEHRSTLADNANASLHHFIRDGVRAVQGTIVLGMNGSPEFTVVTVVNFLARQD